MKIALATRWKIEIIWWIITAVILVVVMLPIYTKAPDFPFIPSNLLYIIVAITYTRYIFLLRYTPIAWSIPFKIIFPVSALLITFMFAGGLMELQRLLDEEGFLFFLGHLTGNEASSMAKYIHAEFFFFGVASVICSIILAFRMIISIYRQINKDTV